MEIVPQPLTQEAFAPFGDVIDVPQQAGRTYYCLLYTSDAADE